MTPEQDRYFRRATAVRRIVLGPDGKLSRDGRVLALLLQRLCYAAPNQTIVAADANGRVDETATVARAARRELWDKLVSLLNLDQYDIVNLRED